ncbi:MAG TPA: hypothetical protein VFZ70_01065 [Euzebyales bacterium]
MTGDVRFDRPLYTMAEAARYLGVPESTYNTWVRGYVRRPPNRPAVHGDPVITSIAAPAGRPIIPFVGLTESMVVAAFRRGTQYRIHLKEIRQAVRRLEEELDIEHVLASQHLYTDGAKILYDYANGHARPLSGLTQVVDGQRVFDKAIEEYLERIRFDGDEWATELVLPCTRNPILLVRPDRAGGHPVFINGSAPLDAVIGRVRAGDSIEDVARDFGVPSGDVRDAAGVAFGEAA